MATPRSDSSLTQAELKSWLHYDPLTGVFTWLQRAALNTHVGDRAGNSKRTTKPRRVTIRLHGIRYHAGRLAWFYMTGEWPKALVDHEDGDIQNQRWSNLRDVSTQVNGENQRKAATSNKSSGLLGVTWSKKNLKWQAAITVNKKFRYLGQFDDPNVAHQAYLEAKRRLHAGCTI